MTHPHDGKVYSSSTVLAETTISKFFQTKAEYAIFAEDLLKILSQGEISQSITITSQGVYGGFCALTITIDFSDGTLETTLRRQKELLSI